MHLGLREARGECIPPEEATSGIIPTIAADIYEFGCLFYMILKKGAPIPDNLPLKSPNDSKKYLASERTPPLDGLQPIASDLIAKYLEAAGSIGNSEGLNASGELTEVSGGLEVASELYGKAALLGSEIGLTNYGKIVSKLPREDAEDQGSSDEVRVRRGLKFVADGAFENAAAEFRLAAAAGSGDGLFGLGWLAEQGRFEGNAEELYREAMNRGSTKARNNLGVLLVRSGRKEDGYNSINEAARQGDACAMNNIAVGIENGEFPGDIRVVAGLYRDAGMLLTRNNSWKKGENGRQRDKRIPQKKYFLRIAFI
jgi:TPR repeat protein